MRRISCSQLIDSCYEYVQQQFPEFAEFVKSPGPNTFEVSMNGLYWSCIESNNEQLYETVQHHEYDDAFVAFGDDASEQLGIDVYYTGVGLRFKVKGPKLVIDKATGEYIRHYE